MPDLLTRTQLEAWVFEIADTVARGQKVEDFRVELKADWPDPTKTARRLAGHANAARGEPLLWIIGLDEDKGPVPTSSTDTSRWWPQVVSGFDAEPPSLILDVKVTVGDVALTALYFTTLQPPYVVRNPEGGTIGYEVPWREGTDTRTARHEQLVRVLVPVVSTPEYEPRYCILRVQNWQDSREPRPRYTWQVLLGLYTVPGAHVERVVIPTHRCGLQVAEAAALRAPEFKVDSFRTVAHLATAGASEVILSGPALVQLEAWSAGTYDAPDTTIEDATVQVLLSPVGSASSEISVRVSSRRLAANLPPGSGRVVALWTSHPEDEREELLPPPIL